MIYDPNHGLTLTESLIVELVGMIFKCISLLNLRESLIRVCSFVF
jgi:hypothetical protein